MALQITECQGMFSVHGALNSGNAQILKRHMGHFIGPERPVILNLERVMEIDAGAANMLEQLYISALRSNSILAIIGQENQSILPVLKQTRTSYILSNDRI